MAVISFWLIAAATLVVAGTAQYFFFLPSTVWWTGYALCAFLFIIVIRCCFREALNLKPQLTIMEWSALAFMGIVAVPTLMNAVLTWQEVRIVLGSVQRWFLYSAIWIALVGLPLSKAVVRSWLAGLLVIGLCQWPTTAYQYIYVRAARLQIDPHSVEASDSVVGTFGGNMMAGGQSGALAAYLVILIVCLLAFYRNAEISRGRLSLFIILLGAPLLLMEVKIIFVYLPVTLFLLYMDVLWERPLDFLKGSVVMLVILSLMLLAYHELHWKANNHSIAKNIPMMFSYSFRKSVQGKNRADRGMMTRREVLEFWWQKHTIKDPWPLLFGHGLGASKSDGWQPPTSRSRVGRVAKRYQPKFIDRTGLALLLWDTGLLGVAAVLGMFLGSYRLANRLACSSRLAPWYRSLAKGLGSVVPIFLLSLLYKRDLHYSAPMMFTCMTVLGLLSWMQHQKGELTPQKPQTHGTEDVIIANGQV